MMYYNGGNFFLVYEIDGLDTSDDTLTVYYYAFGGGKGSINLSKASLGTQSFMGHFNIGTV